MSTKPSTRSFSSLNLWEVFCGSCVAVIVSLIGTSCSLFGIFSCDYFDNAINVQRFGESVEIVKATIGLFRYSIEDEVNFVESTQCMMYQSSDVTFRLQAARFFSIFTPVLALAGCVFCVLGMKYLEARWTLWGMLLFWSLTPICQIIGYSALRATNFCDTKDGQGGCSISKGSAFAIVSILAHFVSIICALTIIQMKIDLKVQYAAYRKKRALRKLKGSSKKSESFDYASADLENQRIKKAECSASGKYGDKRPASEECEDENQQQSIPLARNRTSGSSYTSVSSGGKSRFSASSTSLTHIAMTGEMEEFVSSRTPKDSNSLKRRENSEGETCEVKNEEKIGATMNNDHARMSKNFEDKVLSYIGSLGVGCGGSAFVEKVNDGSTDVKTTTTNGSAPSKGDHAEIGPTEPYAKISNPMKKFSVFQAGTGILNFLGPEEPKSEIESKTQEIQDKDLATVSQADVEFSKGRKPKGELHDMPSYPKLLNDIRAMIAARDESLMGANSHNLDESGPKPGVEYDSVANLVEMLILGYQTDQNSDDPKREKMLYDMEDCNKILEDFRFIIARAMQKTEDSMAESGTSASRDDWKKSFSSAFVDEAGDSTIDLESLSQMVDLLLMGYNSGQQSPKAGAEASVGENKTVDAEILSKQSWPMDEATQKTLPTVSAVTKEGSQAAKIANLVSEQAMGDDYDALSDENSRTRDAQHQSGTESKQKNAMEQLNAALRGGVPSACMNPCNRSEGMINSTSTFEEAVFNCGVDIGEDQYSLASLSTAPSRLWRPSSIADQETLGSFSTAPSRPQRQSSESVGTMSHQQHYHAPSWADSTRYDESLTQDASLTSGYESEDLIEVPECGPLTSPVRGALYAIGCNGKGDRVGPQHEKMEQEEAEEITTVHSQNDGARRFLASTGSGSSNRPRGFYTDV